MSCRFLANFRIIKSLKRWCMHSLELVPGMQVVARGEPCIVVELKSLTTVKVQAIDSRQLFIVEVEDIKFLPSSVDGEAGSLKIRQPLKDLDRFTQDDIALANQRFVVIKKFRAGDITLEQAMKTTNLSRSAFYRMNSRFDLDAGRESLLPNKSGRCKGATSIGSDVELIITNAIKKEYKGPGATYLKVWREVQAQCSKLTIEIPSKTAVNTRIKAVGVQALYKLKYGGEAARQKYGAKPGKKSHSRPLERVQIDHTMVDCILVDEVTRLPLFRPWLTLLIDIKTRVILGYYIAFHPPSAISVACALTHAVLPKQRYLRNIEVEDVEHPFHGVPERLHMDNAREFRSYKLQRACAIHGIIPEYRRRGKKEDGGHIERLIGTMMIGQVRMLPGATMSNVIEKGDYDSEKNAALALPEFIRWFAGQVEVYNYTEHSALKCSPAEMWFKFFQTDSGDVISPKLVANPFKFRLDFMPEVERDIRPVGVLLFNRAYWSPILKAYVGKKKVTIKYDPFSLGMIWARIDDEYIDLKFADLTLDNLSYEQHLASNYSDLRDRSKVMPANVIAIRGNNELLVEESKKITKRDKRQVKGKEGYMRHVSDQHYDRHSIPKPVNRPWFRRHLQAS
ncbi:transposase [Pseudomonas monteilii]|nr:transposase [Pseudomonas monteilii]